MPKKTRSPDAEHGENKWKQFAQEHEDAEQSEFEEMSEAVDEAQTLGGIEYPSRDNLEDQLTATEKVVDEYKQKLLRAQAEMDNVRRRAERDVQDAHKFGKEKLILDLLPVLDSLTRALEGPEPTDAAQKSMHEGILLTLSLFEKALAKYDVAVLDPAKGEPFNPEQHEAVSMMADPEADPNTIIQVLQKGYALNGRVLRAAMVIVAQ